jgi:hypothetical protein
MERDTGKPLSHSLNTQLFSVVGQAYVPYRTSEFSPEIEPLRAVPATKNCGRKRWLVFYALAALVVLAANLINIGTIVHATTRPAAKPAAIMQSLGGATSFGVFGGIEASLY